MVDVFVDGGIYKLKDTQDDTIFLCSAMRGNRIGKLCQYVAESECKENQLYRKSGLQFFLNCYVVGDFKERFVRRENYDQVGMLFTNYYPSVDNEYLVANLNPITYEGNLID